MLEDSKYHSKPIKGWTRDMYPALSQTNNRDEANGKSEWKDYVNGSDAWTAKHSVNSHEKEFTEETAFEATQGVATNPNGYQKMLEDHKYHSKPIKGWTRDMYPALAQKSKTKYDHLHEAQSYIKPYNQRDHSWNEDEFDHSHEKNWDKETKAPSTDTHYEPGISTFGYEAGTISPGGHSLAQKYDHLHEA
jgi:hypothetical protein